MPDTLLGLPVEPKKRGFLTPKEPGLDRKKPDTNFFINAIKDTVLSAVPGGQAAPVILPIREKIRKRIPKEIKKFSAKTDVALIAPALSLVDLAEQVGVPIAKGEGVIGIDVLGKDRSILEFPKIKEGLANLLDLSARLLPQAIPDQAAISDDILAQIPDNVKAEALRLGGKVLLAGGVRKGFQAIANRAKSISVQNLSDLISKRLREASPNAPIAEIEKATKKAINGVLAGRIPLGPEGVDALRLFPKLGQRGFARLPSKLNKTQLVQAIQKLSPQVKAEELIKLGIGALQSKLTALEGDTLGLPTEAPKEEILGLPKEDTILGLPKEEPKVSLEDEAKKFDTAKEFIKSLNLKKAREEDVFVRPEFFVRGKSGISDVETFSDERPLLKDDFKKAIVYRDIEGTPQGALTFNVKEDGSLETKEDFGGGAEIFVNPSFRRQGIATRLRDKAKQLGFDINKIEDRAFTTEGRKFEESQLTDIFNKAKGETTPKDTILKGRRGFLRGGQR